MEKTHAKLKFLTSYAIFMTVVMVSLVLFSFKAYKKIVSFDEINVKRINIIENDGTIRMVLSNKERQHSGRMDGEDMEKRERAAGLLFFTDEGDECGGVIYYSMKTKNGAASGMSITMDRYKNDQVVQMTNQEEIANGKIVSQRGIMINDFPAESHLGKTLKAMKEAEKITNPEEREKKMKEISARHGGANLLFLGKTDDNSQGLFLNDAKGKPKMRIYVDGKGNPKIQTYNSKGEIKDLITE